jgi:hypothetical protein
MIETRVVNRILKEYGGTKEVEMKNTDHKGGGEYPYGDIDVTISYRRVQFHLLNAKESTDTRSTAFSSLLG